MADITAGSPFHYRVLSKVIEQIKPAPMLYQDLLFKERNSHGADTIDVELLDMDGTKILPFVSDVEGGKIVAKSGREMRTIKTLRVRPRTDFSAKTLLQLTEPGKSRFNPNNATLNAAQKALIGRELKLLKMKIDTTKEYMCAQALQGALIVNQPNISVLVDYLIATAHKPTASPLWNGTNPTIRKDLDAWNQLLIDDSGGGATHIFAGVTAFNAMIDDTATREGIKTTSGFDTGKFTWRASSNYFGNLGGIECYRYGGTYRDLAGNVQKLIGDNDLIMVNANARFSIEHGNILDLKAGSYIAEYFSKAWETEDPSGLSIIAESRPLPVIWQPGAVIKATVTS